jgi:DNA (cytosine-5)-methyltransferase 1
MKLYEEIILLNNFFKGKYAVENVEPYYTKLIPSYSVGRHSIWSNFIISNIKLNNHQIINEIKGSNSVYGFDLTEYKIENKRQILRNLVNPKVGLHIFNCAFKIKQKKVMEF